MPGMFERDKLQQEDLYEKIPNTFLMNIYKQNTLQQADMNDIQNS